MPTKTHYLQSNPLKTQDAANLTIFSHMQMRITFVDKCLLEMTKAMPCLPKSRTKTKAWTLMTPHTRRVNTTSSIKVSSHIIWTRWSWFSMSRKAVEPNSISAEWMVLMIFISCLKHWRICSLSTFYWDLYFQYLRGDDQKQEIYWTSYQLSYWKQAGIKSIVTAE